MEAIEIVIFSHLSKVHVHFTAGATIVQLKQLVKLIEFIGQSRYTKESSQLINHKSLFSTESESLIVTHLERAGNTTQFESSVCDNLDKIHSETRLVSIF